MIMFLSKKSIMKSIRRTSAVIMVIILLLGICGCRYEDKFAEQLLNSDPVPGKPIS